MSKKYIRIMRYVIIRHDVHQNASKCADFISHALSINRIGKIQLFMMATLQSTADMMGISTVVIIEYLGELQLSTTKSTKICSCCIQFPKALRRSIALIMTCE